MVNCVHARLTTGHYINKTPDNAYTISNVTTILRFCFQFYTIFDVNMASFITSLTPQSLRDTVKPAIKCIMRIITLQQCLQLT